MVQCPNVRPRHCRDSLSCQILERMPSLTLICYRSRYWTTNHRQCGFAVCSIAITPPPLFLRFPNHHLGATFSRPGIGGHSHLHLWRQFRASGSESTRTQPPQFRPIEKHPRSQHQVITSFSKGEQLIFAVENNQLGRPLPIASIHLRLEEKGPRVSRLRPMFRDTLIAPMPHAHTSTRHIQAPHPLLCPSISFHLQARIG
jgi:hypothetical protein